MKNPQLLPFFKITHFAHHPWSVTARVYYGDLEIEKNLY